MLLPLTSAVYVSGKLASHDSILLDIGTGYYAEVTIWLSFGCSLDSMQVLKKRKTPRCLSQAVDCRGPQKKV